MIKCGADRMIYPKTNSLLVYPCTLVGYMRLALLMSAVGLHLLYDEGGGLLWERIVVAGLIGLSLLLDGLDGHLARKLGHTSRFGALVDLTIDLSTHTVAWGLSGVYLTVPLIVLEWNTGLYVAVFSGLPLESWKDLLVERGPALIQSYFSNRQRNLLSIYGNFSHFAFPMALYAQLSAPWPYYLSLPGLILYELVTLYLLYIFIRILVENKG